MLPYPNESIHSFIFRVYRQLGVDDFSSVITSQGQWHRKPSVVSVAKRAILALKDEELLLLMRQTGYARKQTGIFDDPTSYMQELRGVLDGPNFYPKWRSYRCFNVAFCLDCIHESIRKKGTGYFESNWHFPLYCRKHKAPFYYLANTSRKASIEAIDCILRGELVYAAKQVEGLSCKDDLHYFYPERNDEGEEHMQIALCLKKSFVAWLCSMDHNFPESVLRATGYKTSYPLRRIELNHHICKDYMLKKVLVALLASDYAPFHAYWNRFSQRYMIDCGIFDKTALSEPIYKRVGWIALDVLMGIHMVLIARQAKLSIFLVIFFIERIGSCVPAYSVQCS